MLGGRFRPHSVEIIVTVKDSHALEFTDRINGNVIV